MDLCGWLQIMDLVCMMDIPVQISEMNRIIHSISSNQLHALAEDKEGNIYIATHKGLNIYNRNLKVFKRYTSDPNNKESLNISEVITIFIDSKERIW